MKETNIIKIIKRKRQKDQGMFDGRYKTKTHKHKKKYNRKKKFKDNLDD